MSSCQKNTCGCGAPAVPITSAPLLGNRSDVLTVRIDKIDCPTEKTLLRKKIGVLSGIEDMSFNLMQRRLTIKHQLTDTTPILAAIGSLNMEAVVDNA
ncbi:hypothetical protein Q8A64_18085 [Oxalobacteraceae bacterium R-40]|uniref:HMA domain-containing protein n=1 Tax=Keguizhuia sedimenti TaxID=3064264 RepID=A0ABU1BTT9_9BURK|nr:hypothetical protein [Oxalobacteraceae bacterium R-40]